MDEPGQPVTRAAASAGGSLGLLSLGLVVGGVLMLFLGGSPLWWTLGGSAFSFGSMLALVSGATSAVGLFGSGRRGYALAGVGASLAAVVVTVIVLAAVLFWLSEAFN